VTARVPVPEELSVLPRLVLTTRRGWSRLDEAGMTTEDEVHQARVGYLNRLHGVSVKDTNVIMKPEQKSSYLG
jgi:hypothetical protein